MYTQDLNTAFMVETARRHDEMEAARMCHLAHECPQKPSELVALPGHLLGLLLAVLAFVNRHWAAHPPFHR